MARRFRDAVAALNDLLDAAERQPDRSRNLVYPDYQAMKSDSERETFHRTVAGAEAAGAVTIRRKKYAGPADINFISLADAACLALWLRRVPVDVSTERAVAELRRRVGAVPEWIDAIIGEIAAAWVVQRAPYPGLEPRDVPAAAKFLLILAAIDRGDHARGWDMRTFSRRACGDSKAVEAGTARLERVLRARLNLPWTRHGEVLTALGIEKFPWPVLIRGALRLPGGAEIDARPYCGLPPEMVQNVTVAGTVPYVLIIENLASFNRHAREIDDGGVLVYAGGFPSRATLSLIRYLDAALPRSVAFFHWGDADHHGRLILDHIATAIGRPLSPHLMDRPEGEEQEETDPQSPTMLYPEVLVQCENVPFSQS